VHRKYLGKLLISSLNTNGYYQYSLFWKGMLNVCKFALLEYNVYTYFNVQRHLESSILLKYLFA
jgi:hypothetical protein